jgi:hypothetical protein
MLSRVTALVTGASLAACSVVGIRETEEPGYRVIDRVGRVEVREYGPRIAAETSVPGGEMGARSTGFRRLAGYIFGDNRPREKIAMTAPVAQSGDAKKETIAMTAPVAQSNGGSGGGTGPWTIRFFMPANYTMATLPEPANPAVKLVEVPGETVAVLRYAGSTAPETVAAKQDELTRALRTGAWQAVGAPVTWFYDPPWTLPPFRRTEAVVVVSRR